MERSEMVIKGRKLMAEAVKFLRLGAEGSTGAIGEDIARSAREAYEHPIGFAERTHILESNRPRSAVEMFREQDRRREAASAGGVAESPAGLTHEGKLVATVDKAVTELIHGCQNTGAGHLVNTLGVTWDRLRVWLNERAKTKRVPIPESQLGDVLKATVRLMVAVRTLRGGNSLVGIADWANEIHAKATSLEGHVQELQRALTIGELATVKEDPMPAPTHIAVPQQALASVTKELYDAYQILRSSNLTNTEAMTSVANVLSFLRVVQIHPNRAKGDTVPTAKPESLTLIFEIDSEIKAATYIARTLSEDVARLSNQKKSTFPDIAPHIQSSLDKIFSRLVSADRMMELLTALTTPIDTGVTDAEKKGRQVNNYVEARYCKAAPPPESLQDQLLRADLEVRRETARHLHLENDRMMPPVVKDGSGVSVVKETESAECRLINAQAALCEEQARSQRLTNDVTARAAAMCNIARDPQKG